MTPEDNIWPWRRDSAGGGSRIGHNTADFRPSNNGHQMNGTSCKNDDDDYDLEALKESIPSYKCAVLDGVGDTLNLSAVDVKHLSRVQRQRLLDKAFATTEQDNEILLSRIKERLDRVGVRLPTVEVQFHDISVNADVYVGNRALPTLVNFVKNIFEASLTWIKLLPSHKINLPILKKVSGVVKPGRLTLLLGPPGAGKSTLLMALAGKLDRSLQVGGRVLYNGYPLSAFTPQRVSSYVSQEDNHIAQLTTRETLDFAARCQGSGFPHGVLKEVAKREREYNVDPDPDIDTFMKAMAVEGAKHNISVDYILRVLGLDICADTIIGDHIIRGISGGQKKRVTTGEMIVGSKRTFFMDGISTGLDSSTTFQIIKCLKNFVHLLQGTILVALLQPAPETFELFDDVIVLAEGHIVYEGPREKILEFFSLLGFHVPPRKGVADFLQEVTSRKDQEQYWADKKKPYQYVSVLSMADAFKSFEVGMELTQYLSVSCANSKHRPHILQREKYAVPKWDLFKACFEQESILMVRNKFVYTFRTLQVTCMAIITGTLFFRKDIKPIDDNNGFLYLSVLFFSLVHLMFNGMSEMTMILERLPVFYKQRDNLFYPSWIYVLPSVILRVPYSAVEALIWSCVVYFCVGLAPGAVRFIKFLLLLFLMHQMAVSLFRLIGALGRIAVVAQTFGSFALLIVFVLGGFIISENSIQRWWIWAYWLSPLSYAQTAIAVNEFLAPRWNKPSLNGHGPLYLSILKAKSLRQKEYWYWVAIGVLAAYTILFNFLVASFTT